jgi:hypothetical protein
LALKAWLLENANKQVPEDHASNDEGAMALRFPLPSATYQQAIGTRSEKRPKLGRHRQALAFDGQGVGAAKTTFVKVAYRTPAYTRKMT